ALCAQQAADNRTPGRLLPVIIVAVGGRAERTPCYLVEQARAAGRAIQPLLERAVALRADHGHRRNYLSSANRKGNHSQYSAVGLIAAPGSKYRLPPSSRWLQITSFGSIGHFLGRREFATSMSRSPTNRFL